MKIRFWGVRGSLATPLTNASLKEKITRVLALAVDAGLSDKKEVNGFFKTLPEHLRMTAGGNTTCVEIMAGDTCLILDAGTGIRPLGIELMQRAGGNPVTAHILLSHTHWDHICGLPFFIPAFLPTNRITVYGSHPDLENRLRHQQDYEFFPVPLSPKVRFVQLDRQEGLNPAMFDIGPVTIETMPLNHPGGCYGYRITHDGQTVVFATDSEYKDPSSEALEPYVNFFRNADAVIFDAQYSMAENVEKEDWGHSNMFTGIDMALDAGVKKLFFTHHEPENGDRRLWDNLAQAKRYLAIQGDDIALELELAVEGVAIDLDQHRVGSAMPAEKEVKIEITLKNDLSEIEQLAESVRDFGRENWPSDELAWQIRLVLEEVVTNIISYGYEDQADHTITVTVLDSEQDVTLSIRDDARPFNLLEHPVPDLEIPLEDRKVGGMGIHMVRQIMDAIEYKREAGENRLLMRKSKKPQD